MTVLLLSVLAHVIADFCLQSDNIVYMKNNKQFLGFLLHGLIIFSSLFILLIFYNLKTILIYTLLITSIHIAIDYLKCFIIDIQNKLFDLICFVTDQIIHIIIILALWKEFNFEINNLLFSWVTNLIEPKNIAAFSSFEIVNTNLKTAKIIIPSINTIILTSIIYLSIGFGGAIFIRKYLDFFSPPSSNVNISSNASGKHIGILERIMIITFILNDSIGSIAFILAAKSLARFNLLNDKDFAEYYLLGTLFSTLLGIIGGYTLRYSLTLFNL